MDAVRAIGFDIDHTLAIDNRLERVAFLRLLEAILDEGAKTVGTLADEIASIDDLLARQRRGEFSIDDAVRYFVTQRDLEPSDRHVVAFRSSAVEMVDEFVVALPGVRTTLETIRGRDIAVAVLTNGWNPLQARKAAKVGFQGPVLVSSEIGEQKPSAGAFERLSERLGVAPTATWYVGDDPSVDVAGAQGVGMRAVWLDWEHKEYPVDLRGPDRTIRNFPDLLEILTPEMPVR
ncbi:MAG: HAD family hydrolase [Candidatus Eremiobacteraeota bacterium]|nr:HAD family hydrolase [Candidatus Eremiobacteraeota bacterium]